MKSTVRQRILLPVLALMILLPLLSSVIFRETARSFAIREAEDNMNALRGEVETLAEAYYADETAQPSREQVSEFLRKAGRLVRRAKGDAQLLVYAAESKLVFPGEEPEDSEVYALSDALLPYLTDDAAGEGRTVTVAGEDFLVSVSRLPGRSLRTQFVAVYCPVSHVGQWVEDASWLAFAVSCGVAGIMTIAVVLIARGITRPLSRLNLAAKRVAKGDYDRIEKTSSVKELENLRRSVNEMSEALERSEEEKKLFFQNLSHELRTPLMSIGGYAQGSERGVLPDAPAAARVILSESNRLSELVDELLTLSRLDRSEAPDLSPLSLSELIREASSRAAGVALQKGVAVEVKDFAECTVSGEKGLLGKVLDNLISNAVRHAESRVILSVNPEGDAVRVSVADDGAGIAPEDFPHLFKRGYKGKNGHFGLGLTIARQAAAACGAELSASNDPAGGAVFTLTLKRG